MPDTVDKKWLDDPLAQKGWRLTVERAKAASKMGWPAHTAPTTSHCSDVLHAAALIESQREEIERLKLRNSDLGNEIRELRVALRSYD